MQGEGVAGPGRAQPRAAASLLGEGSARALGRVIVVVQVVVVSRLAQLRVLGRQETHGPSRCSGQVLRLAPDAPLPFSHPHTQSLSESSGSAF